MPNGRTNTRDTASTTWACRNELSDYRADLKQTQDAGEEKTSQHPQAKLVRPLQGLGGNSGRFTRGFGFGDISVLHRYVIHPNDLPTTQHDMRLELPFGLYLPC
jgi:hypothetical protein